MAATRDLHNNITTKQLLAAQAITATTTSAHVDTLGFGALELVASIGTVTNAGTGTWAFKLQHSDTTTSGDFVDVTDEFDVVFGNSLALVTKPNSSTGVFLLVDHADEDALTYRIGYVGAKRYVRVVATAASTPGSTPISIVAILANPISAPAKADA